MEGVVPKRSTNSGYNALQAYNGKEEEVLNCIKKNRNDVLIHILSFLSLKSLLINQRVCKEWLESIFGVTGVLCITWDIRLREIIELKATECEKCALKFNHKIVFHSLGRIYGLESNNKLFFKYTDEIVLPIVSPRKEVDPSYLALEAYYKKNHAHKIKKKALENCSHDFYMNIMYQSIMGGLYANIGNIAESQKCLQEIAACYKKIQDSNILIIAAIELTNLDLVETAIELIKKEADFETSYCVFYLCGGRFLQWGRYDIFQRFSEAAFE